MVSFSSLSAPVEEDDSDGEFSFIENPPPAPRLGKRGKKTHKLNSDLEEETTAAPSSSSEASEERRSRGRRRKSDHNEDTPKAKRGRLDSSSTPRKSNTSSTAAIIQPSPPSTAKNDTSPALQAMQDIIDSPYEGNFSAEVGEPLFLQMKEDLCRFSERSERLVGIILSQNLQLAKEYIQESGNFFCHSWLDGSIQVNKETRTVGWIPRNLYLLLLNENTFATAPEKSWMYLTKNLNVVPLVLKAIKEWRFSYPRLEANSATLNFPREYALSCYKAQVFVARVYRCQLALQNSIREESLDRKLNQCLSLLDKHVILNGGAQTRLQRMSKRRKHASKSRKKRSASFFLEDEETSETASEEQYPVLCVSSSASASAGSSSITTDQSRGDEERALRRRLFVAEKQYAQLANTLKSLGKDIKSLEQERERESLTEKEETPSSSESEGPRRSTRPVKKKRRFSIES